MSPRTPRTHPAPKDPMPRTLRRRPRRLLSLTLPALAALTLTTAPAHAAGGEFTQVLCANPDTGQGLGVDRVQGLLDPPFTEAWAASISEVNCGTGPMTSARAIALGPTTDSTVPHDQVAAVQFQVLDPALSLVRAELFRAFTSTDPTAMYTSVALHAGHYLAPPAAPVLARHGTGGPAAGRMGEPFHPDNRFAFERAGRQLTITAHCASPSADRGCTHRAHE